MSNHTFDALNTRRKTERGKASCTLYGCYHQEIEICTRHKEQMSRAQLLLHWCHNYLPETLEILKSLDTSKASGPDGISCKMLKETAYSIAHPSLDC